MPKEKWQWIIRGYDGVSLIYERRVDAGQITEGQMKALLMALAAKAGLTFDEIVSAYAKKGTRIHHDFLLVQRDGPHCRFYCGSDPHFVAEARKA